MRRSGVRIPLAPQTETPLDQGKRSGLAGFLRCLGGVFRVVGSPEVPPTVIQALQARDIGTGPEEVQVPVRRRGGLVAAPRLHRREVHAPGGATTETVFTQGQSPTQAGMQATAAMVRSPGPGITGGSAGNAGNPGAAASGPTEAEIAAKAREVMNKSITDVAIELGWEALKDFIGWNDLMGCLSKDIASCAMLAIGILPVGKGLKAVKALGKIVDGAISFYKQQKSARKILDQVGSARRAPGCNSFAPGTLVLLADGSKKHIEDIELGDEVLAADEETGKRTGGREVTALITGEGDKTLVTISLSSADGKTEPIVATDEHPFWLPAKSTWEDAIDVVRGDWLQTSPGSWAQVIEVNVNDRRSTV